MEYGLESYSDTGILQFDTDFSQYALSKIITMPSLAGSPAPSYTATDKHVLVGYSSDGYIPALPSTMWTGGNNFKVEMGKDYYRPNTTPNGKALVFEPFNVVAAGPSPIGVGLECYDSNGKTTYSTVYPNLRVIAVHKPPLSTSGNNLYGTGAGVISSVEYRWKTSILANDVSNYAVFFSQQRFANRVDYDDSSVVIFMYEQPILTISNDGYLVVSFKGIDGTEVDYGAAFGSVLTYITRGDQIAYVVDVSAFKNKL